MQKHKIQDSDNKKKAKICFLQHGLSKVRFLKQHRFYEKYQKTIFSLMHSSKFLRTITLSIFLSIFYLYSYVIYSGFWMVAV